MMARNSRLLPRTLCCRAPVSCRRFRMKLSNRNQKPTGNLSPKSVCVLLPAVESSKQVTKLRSQKLTLSETQLRRVILDCRRLKSISPAASIIATCRDGRRKTVPRHSMRRMLTTFSHQNRNQNHERSTLIDDQSGQLVPRRIQATTTTRNRGKIRIHRQLVYNLLNPGFEHHEQLGLLPIRFGRNRSAQNG